MILVIVVVVVVVILAVVVVVVLAVVVVMIFSSGSGGNGVSVAIEKYQRECVCACFRTNGHIVSNYRWLAVVASYMHDYSILNVCVVSNGDLVDVSAKNRIIPDRRVFTQRYVPNNMSTRCNKHVFRNRGLCLSKVHYSSMSIHCRVVV